MLSSKSNIFKSYLAIFSIEEGGASNIKKRRKKGQSTLEYMLLIVGVSAALFYLASPGGPFNKSVLETLDKTTESLTQQAGGLSRLTGASGGSFAAVSGGPSSLEPVESEGGPTPRFPPDPDPRPSEPQVQEGTPLVSIPAEQPV